jgi:isopenicillin N synthase-like dioxygenase
MHGNTGFDIQGKLKNKMKLDKAHIQEWAKKQMETAKAERREAIKGTVPVIDISALRGPDSAEKQDVVNLISAACEEIGFFVITNHGVDQTVLDNTWKSVFDFFSLDEAEKQKWAGMTEEYPYGYEQGEVLAAGKSAEKGEVGDIHADIKETMTIGPSNPASGMPARILPTSPADYAKHIEQYYTEMESLSATLLSAMAVGLNLPEDWFVSKTDHHISALRTLNYPNQDKPPEPGQLRAGAHTDYGTLTILRSGGPGLQVAKDKDDPSWVEVPSVDNAFIINLGDLMRRWTNDKYSSTLHRVVNPPLDGKDHRRQSIAFFGNANPDLLVETIPTCLNENGSSNYEPIVAKDFLMMKHLASVKNVIKEEPKKAHGGEL